jgi:hypothetical protein
MTDFSQKVWAVADANNWTDNALLHELLDVIECEPQEVQDRLVAALDPEMAEAKVNQDALWDQVADSMKVWLAANNMTMEQAYFSHEFLKEVVRLTEELGIEPEEDND